MAQFVETLEKRTHLSCTANAIVPLINASVLHLFSTSQWLHNERDGVSNHRISIVCSIVYSGADKKKIKAPRHGALWGETGEFPTQRTSNAEMFPFDDVIMRTVFRHCGQSYDLCSIIRPVQRFKNCFIAMQSFYGSRVTPLIYY